MATSNPAFSNSPAFSQSATKAIQWTKEPSAQELDELYARSAATPEQLRAVLDRHQPDRRGVEHLATLLPTADRGLT